MWSHSATRWWAITAVLDGACAALLSSGAGLIREAIQLGGESIALMARSCRAGWWQSGFSQDQFGLAKGQLNAPDIGADR